MFVMVAPMENWKNTKKQVKSSKYIVFAVFLLLVNGACQALDYDMNDAVLSITPEGEAQQTLSHDPGLSEIRVTPPADQGFTASFTYLDPSAELVIAIEDASALEEQSDISMPLDASLLSMRVQFADKDYRADLGGCQGYLTIERLEVGADSVSFRASFQGSLLDDNGAKAAVDGYLDASYTGESGQ